MKKEDFLNIKLEQIKQVYVGESDCCRCGCRGDYITTQDNPKLVEKRLKRAKRLIKNGNLFDLDSSYIDITTGKNRALTLYFK